MDEIGEITDYISDKTDGSADVIWGAGIDDTLEDELRVTLIATGFESGQRTEDRRQKTEDKKLEPVDKKTNTEEGNSQRTVHRLDETDTHEPPVESKPNPEPVMENTPAPEVKEDTTPSRPTVVVHSLDEKEDTPQFDKPVFTHEQTTTHEVAATIHTIEPTPNVRRFDNPFANRNNDDEGFEISNSTKVTSLQKENEEVETMVMEEPKVKQYDPKEELKRNRLRALSLNFKTQKGLEELERQPAYMRRDMNYEEMEPEDEVSRYTTTSKGISSENSFLHDNVD